MDVILVAAKKDVVQSYVDVIEKAGLKPVIVDVDSFALETMYEANYDFEDNDVVVLINMGASMTNIIFFKPTTPSQYFLLQDDLFFVPSFLIWKLFI